MKKKPVIVTIVIVAAAAILIGGGIYLYPHLVERTVSQIVKNDMTDVVQIDFFNANNGRRAEVTNKEDIDETIQLIKNLKAKKSFDQGEVSGNGLIITLTTSNGKKISISCWLFIRGVKYEFNEREKESRDNIRDYLVEKYGLNEWPEEEMAEAAE